MDPKDLDGVELFAGSSADEKGRLADVLKRERHPTGSVLVEEGDIPTKFFILLSGAVTVHREGRHVADLGPGDFVGELGVLTLQNRNASVICTLPSEVAVAMGWGLRKLLDELPDLRARLEKAAAARMS